MKYKISFNLDFKRNPYKGTLIAFEGLDASGKTTQVELLAEALRKKGKRVFLTKNPTRTGPIGELVHKILQKEIKAPGVSLQYIYSADRQIQQLEIIERLKRGEIVITDRYFWSAVPYGIADLKSLSIENQAKMIVIAQSLLSHYHSFIVPDYTIYLRIGIKEAIKRLSKMEKVKEIYEEKDALEKVKMGYEWLAEEFKKEFIVIDGEKKKEEVSREIISKIKL